MAHVFQVHFAFENARKPAEQGRAGTARTVHGVQSEMSELSTAPENFFQRRELFASSSMNGKTGTPDRRNLLQPDDTMPKQP